jgi:hypothetical protein
MNMTNLILAVGGNEAKTKDKEGMDEQNERKKYTKAANRKQKINYSKGLKPFLIAKALRKNTTHFTSGINNRSCFGTMTKFRMFC